MLLYVFSSPMSFWTLRVKVWFIEDVDVHSLLPKFDLKSSGPFDTSGDDLPNKNPWAYGCGGKLLISRCFSCYLFCEWQLLMKTVETDTSLQFTFKCSCGSPYSWRCMIGLMLVEMHSCAFLRSYWEEAATVTCTKFISHRRDTTWSLGRGTRDMKYKNDTWSSSVRPLKELGWPRICGWPRTSNAYSEAKYFNDEKNTLIYSKSMVVESWGSTITAPFEGSPPTKQRF